MFSPKVLIRTARRDDVPALAVLIAEFAEYMHALGDTTEVRLDAAALERDGFGPRPAFDGLVADDAGELVGLLLYHDGYDTDAACRLLFVVDLFVTSSARGRGIGAALMRAARDEAARRDAQQLVWTVDRRNELGQRFYEGLGAEYVPDLALMSLEV